MNRDSPNMFNHEAENEIEDIREHANQRFETELRSIQDKIVEHQVKVQTDDQVDEAGKEHFKMELLSKMSNLMEFIQKIWN